MSDLVHLVGWVNLTRDVNIDHVLLKGPVIRIALTPNSHAVASASLGLILSRPVTAPAKPGAASQLGPAHAPPRCQPVIHLVGRVTAYLTERVLYLIRMLSRRHTVCVEAVEVPACLDICRALVAPAADTVHRRLSPPGGAVHEASGVCCRMPPMVQHETPELPASDGSAHALPRPLKLPVIARRNDLCEEGCHQYITPRKRL